ncbi:DUF2065 family protein [Erwinia amylovora]|uniref:DUF2065 family protein n=1 Tax=Erwinia amylovora TaxID=552 RepID=UPI0002CA5931|nr:DUF2065 family protein [Erwinia amylovora]CCP08504.1 hypothetical protein BN440_3509 [Erwinia amylovora MR1]
MIFGGVGPMFRPRLWRRMNMALAQMLDSLLRRVGGGLVVAGMVICYLLSLTPAG